MTVSMHDLRFQIILFIAFWLDVECSTFIRHVGYKLEQLSTCMNVRQKRKKRQQLSISSIENGTIVSSVSNFGVNHNLLIWMSMINAVSSFLSVI